MRPTYGVLLLAHAELVRVDTEASIAIDSLGEPVNDPIVNAYTESLAEVQTWPFSDAPAEDILCSRLQTVAKISTSHGTPMTATLTANDNSDPLASDLTFLLEPWCGRYGSDGQHKDASAREEPGDKFMLGFAFLDKRTREVKATLNSKQVSREELRKDYSKNRDGPGLFPAKTRRWSVGLELQNARDFNLEKMFIPANPAVHAFQAELMSDTHWWHHWCKDTYKATFRQEGDNRYVAKLRIFRQSTCTKYEISRDPRTLTGNLWQEFVKEQNLRIESVTALRAMQPLTTEQQQVLVTHGAPSREVIFPQDNDLVPDEPASGWGPVRFMEIFCVKDGLQRVPGGRCIDKDYGEGTKLEVMETLKGEFIRGIEHLFKTDGYAKFKADGSLSVAGYYDIGDASWPVLAYSPATGRGGEIAGTLKADPWALPSGKHAEDIDENDAANFPTDLERTLFK